MDSGQCWIEYYDIHHAKSNQIHLTEYYRHWILWFQRQLSQYLTVERGYILFRNIPCEKAASAHDSTHLQDSHLLSKIWIDNKSKQTKGCLQTLKKKANWMYHRTHHQKTDDRCVSCFLLIPPWFWALAEQQLHTRTQTANTLVGEYQRQHHKRPGELSICGGKPRTDWREKLSLQSKPVKQPMWVNTHASCKHSVWDLKKPLNKTQDPSPLTRRCLLSLWLQTWMILKHDLFING